MSDEQQSSSAANADSDTTTVTNTTNDATNNTTNNITPPPPTHHYDRWTLRHPSSIDYGYFAGTKNSHDGFGRSALPTTTKTASTTAATIIATTTNDENNDNNDSSPSSPSPSPPPPPSKGFYVTTAINYTNGPAHMGHAYEAATTDAIARFARLNCGNSCYIGGGSGGSGGGSGGSGSGSGGGVGAYFVTGADEHGEKIAKTAEKEGKEPIEICDKYVLGFQVLNQRLLITSDDYIRTTSPRHIRTAQALWLRCASSDDIYLDQYTGWYNVKEETFVTDSEAELCNYQDPTTGNPLQRVQEASYFFRMSKYHERLVEHIEQNEGFIRPESHRNAIMKRLRGEKLRDLSVSRTTFKHGIPVPEGFDRDHVMYVWFDALTNYLTGVNALGVNGGNDNNDANDNHSSSLSALWPADVHIIGKDILWFHTVIWPCILFSASLPLPKSVFAHGFVNDKEGKKMSKSVGNVVDPHDMLDVYHVDSFRWYLCKEAPYGGELSFSEESLREMHNAELCDTLGNLVQRVVKLCEKYCGGVVPEVSNVESAESVGSGTHASNDDDDEEGPRKYAGVLDWERVSKAYISKMEAYALEGGAHVAIQACRDINGYLTKEEPWKLKGDEHSQQRQIVVRATLEAVYAVAHLLLPFLPVGASRIFEKLNTPPKYLADVHVELRNLAVGTPITVGDILYERSKSEEEKDMSAKEVGKKKQFSYEEAQRAKREKKAKEIAASKEGQKKNAKNDDAGEDQSDFTKMDIRVGQIVKVWHHPDADKLFCEEIDVGEESGPRQIASGLRGHYTLDEMLNRKVLVVCNLKAAKIVGFSSNGMVLAAKSDDGKRVELISPPPETPVGERVFIDGLSGEPFSSAQVKKKKVWESVVKGLKTGEGAGVEGEGSDGGCVAMWEGKEIRTSLGVCRASSLVGAAIS